MTRKRQRFGSSLKAKVAVEAIRLFKTLSQLAQDHKVHLNQVMPWKRQLQEGAEHLFEGAAEKSTTCDEPDESELFEQIGRLKVDVEWFTKRPVSNEEALKRIDFGAPHLSDRRQCELRCIHQSRMYYKSVLDTLDDLFSMRLIDEQYLEIPFWGSRNMITFLRGQGHEVNRKRTQRLTRLQDIAINSQSLDGGRVPREARGVFHGSSSHCFPAGTKGSHLLHSVSDGFCTEWIHNNCCVADDLAK